MDLKYLFSPLKQGVQLMEEENFPAAAEFFNDLILKDVRNADIYIRLGICNFRMNRLHEAKGALLKSLDHELSDAQVTSILELTNWRMLCSYRFFNGSPSFSNDGRYLAYISARRDTNGDGKINGQDNCGIYIVDLQKNQEQYVVADDYYNSMVVFSPRGDRLAYLSDRTAKAVKATGKHDNPGLYILEMATGRETQILDTSYRIKYITFSPDGKKILFSCWRPADQHSGVYSMDFATGSIDTLVPGVYETTFPSISASGDKLLYSSWRRDTNGDGVVDVRDNSGIYLKNLATASETVICSDDYNNTFPVLSPDGMKVLYLSVRRDTNGDGKLNSLDNSGIYLYDLIKRKERLVVEDCSFNKFINFSPDGKAAVFLSNWDKCDDAREVHDFFENKGIYMVDISSRKVIQIVSDRYYGSRSPVVSPQGNYVAYVSWRKDTNRGLYLAYLDGPPDDEELRHLISNNL